MKFSGKLPGRPTESKARLPTFGESQTPQTSGAKQRVVYHRAMSQQEVNIRPIKKPEPQPQETENHMFVSFIDGK